MGQRVTGLVGKGKREQCAFARRIEYMSVNEMEDSSLGAISCDGAKCCPGYTVQGTVQGTSQCWKSMYILIVEKRRLVPERESWAIPLW